jgi:protoporphyrinogen oxidase
MTSDAHGPADETLVLGAGLAGLGCALALDEAGAPYRVLEAASRVGGLARSELRDGFTFDATGHWLHLADPSIRALVLSILGDDAVWVARSAAIHTHGTFVPYPFQTNLWALPESVREECLRGYLDARRGRGDTRPPSDRSFRRYVLDELGEGIARHFMLPYNEKLWGVDLDALSTDWIGRFVPQPDFEAVVRGASGPPQVATGYNARFVYPARGGIGRLAEGLRARLRGPVEERARVAGICLDARRVRLSDGSTRPFGRLVSTLPLPSLVRVCDGVPDAIRDAASRLRAVSVSYVNVAVRLPPGAPPLEHHWVYFPEARFPFYRAGCPTAAMPSMAPEGCRSFYVEFSHRGPVDGEGLCRDAVSGLRAAGLVGGGDEILFTFARTLPYAYVVFDREREPARTAILRWLASRGVTSVGRFGGWTYGSMEDALKDGRGAARRLLEAA